MKKFCVPKPIVDRLEKTYSAYLKNPNQSIKENNFFEAIREYVKYPCKIFFRNTAIDGDVVNQEICLATFYEIRKKDITPLIPYLNIIINSECVKALRKSKKVQMIYVEAEELENKAYCEDEERFTQELIDQITKSIMDLSPVAQQVLHLKHCCIKKYSRAIIGQLIGKTNDEVRKILFVALRNIRTEIKQWINEKNSESGNKAA